MHRSKALIAILVATVVVASALPAVAADVAFYSFDYDFSLEADTTLTGVSADGSIVVGSQWLPGKPEKFRAFRWDSAGGMQFLSGPYRNRGAYCISGDGKVLGGALDADAGFRQGYLWTEESGIELLSGEEPIGGPNALSFDGAVAVGGHRTALNRSFAYRWSAATGTVNLGDLPGGNVESSAWDVSGDGTIVVGISSVDSGVAPFRWTADEGMVQLPTLRPSRPFGYAHAISTDGSTIVGSSISDSGGEAVVWKGSELTVLGRLAEAGHPTAVDVSYGGEVIVGSQSRQLQGDSTAFRWTRKSGMKSVASLLTMAGVDMTGWQLLQANQVSSNGKVIIGYGINPSGHHSDYVAILPVDLVPEPNSALLITGAICGFALYRQEFAAEERGR